MSTPCDDSAGLCCNTARLWRRRSSRTLRPARPLPWTPPGRQHRLPGWPRRLPRCPWACTLWSVKVGAIFTECSAHREPGWGGQPRFLHPFTVFYSAGHRPSLRRPRPAPHLFWCHAPHVGVSPTADTHIWGCWVPGHRPTPPQFATCAPHPNSKPHKNSDIDAFLKVGTWVHRLLARPLLSLREQLRLAQGELATGNPARGRPLHMHFGHRHLWRNNTMTHTQPCDATPGKTRTLPEPPPQPPAAAAELSDEQLTTVIGGSRNPIQPCLLIPCFIQPCI